MKHSFKILIITAFMAMAPVILMAQTPPHPNDDPTKDPNSTTVGGSKPAGAPVGNGTFILLTLAVAYAGRKVYVMQKSAEQTV